MAFEWSGIEQEFRYPFRYVQPFHFSGCKTPLDTRLQTYNSTPCIPRETHTLSKTMSSVEVWAAHIGTILPPQRQHRHKPNRI